ncbi:hypothetical protein D3C78_1273570 [compost metagenome]
MADFNGYGCRCIEVHRDRASRSNPRSIRAVLLVCAQVADQGIVKMPCSARKCNASCCISGFAAGLKRFAQTYILGGSGCSVTAKISEGIARINVPLRSIVSRGAHIDGCLANQCLVSPKGYAGSSDDVNGR